MLGVQRYITKPWLLIYIWQIYLLTAFTNFTFIYVIFPIQELIWEVLQAEVLESRSKVEMDHKME